MNMDSKSGLMKKPVLVWEVRSHRAGNVIPLHNPAREVQVERETTATEWTVGSNEANDAETVKITMVSSGFGEVVTGRASGNATNMRLAA
jgi:hypothetical protein